MITPNRVTPEKVTPNTLTPNTLTPEKVTPMGLRRTSSLLLLLVVAWPALAGDEDSFPHPFETDASRADTIETGGTCVIRGATVHSAIAPAFLADVFVKNGLIVQIGERLEVPAGTMELDATGYHLTPGIIDTHSHLALDGGTNEGTLSITADCDITDVIDADDVGIYRALAGGVTTMQVLHGSANTIGGRSEVVKLKVGRRAEDLRFPGAPQGIKFALGENPKRSGESGRRFPGSRIGVEAVIRRAFARANEYAGDWEAYVAKNAAGENPPPPRRDVRLEALAGILSGDVLIHSHCYRADEILMLLRVTEEYGVRVETLQHVLEGYKVAYEIAQHGAGTSTFSDWWGYKIEAYDAIPQNAALLDEAGVISTINSDSGELIRHLPHEAGKSVRYAGMNPVAALRLCTLNAAIQLGVADVTGSIEVGKHADLALFTREPMSSYGRVEWTMVDGEIEFLRRDSFGLDIAPLSAAPLTEPTDPDLASMPVAGEGSAEHVAETIAIVGGTVHPVTAPMIERGTVVFRGGRIVSVSDAPPPEDAVVIDATGRHVWPGMIAIDTQVGLMEIGAVAESNDTSVIGGNQPDLRVSASVNPDSRHIGVTRAAGITRVQTVPSRGGPIVGQSAILATAGDTWEEMLFLDRDMLHIKFPTTSNSAKKKEEPKETKELKRLLAAAREYADLNEAAVMSHARPPRHDPRLAALAPYARGQRRIALHVDNAQTILFALKFATQEKDLDLVLIGCTEGWKVADAIARSGIPVVVGPVLRVPSSTYDPYDACYANAAVLYRAGVFLAITSEDGENPRNTPFAAAFAAAYGLPHQVALESVTIRAAKILGIDDRLGSLQPGKVADIVITDGDLLETTTQVFDLFIDGVQTSPRNAQTELYDRYRARLHRLQGR